jgi:biopolymer transport protein ExbD
VKTLKISSRAQRLQKFKSLHKGAGLNLVSLMDIFTILVFFLLVNSSNVQQLPSNKDMSLPTTVAQKAPKETLVISITRDSILVQGVEVASIEAALAEQEILIKPLEKELNFHAEKTPMVAGNEDAQRSVTIMGDEDLPYELLRKILATCRQVNYTHVAFAAMQKAKGKD